MKTYTHVRFCHVFQHTDALNREENSAGQN